MIDKKKEIIKLYKDAMVIHLTRMGYSKMQARILSENIFNNHFKQELKSKKILKKIILDLKK
jgi:hypothetical protein